MQTVFRLVAMAGVVWLCPAGCSGLGGEVVCEGEMWRSCSDLGENLCKETFACTLVPGRCAARCEAHQSARRCTDANCSWEVDRCILRCDSARTEEVCFELRYACQWDGAECKNVCAPLESADACDAAGCSWLMCEGAAKPCDAYPGDACPTSLGCDRIKRGGRLSTQ